MSELAKQLFAGLAAVKETAQALAPGLKNLVPDLGGELKQQAAHGAHELAAALFNGHGFVLYSRGGKDDHGIHGPEQAPGLAQDHPSIQPAAPAHELERGGRRSM